MSPLRPLLCRHDFYWSERHHSDRCRRCGKLQEAEPLGVIPNSRPVALPTIDAASGFRSAGRAFIDFDDPRPRPIRAPAMLRPSARVLKAEAQERRDRLPGQLDRLVAGVRPTREEAIDTILAVIEDAHSANPVLFGPETAGRFARLRKALSEPGC